MNPQPMFGLFLHACGGAAAASFYAPLKLIRRWPWESFYLAMGVFSWLCTPWIFAGLTTPDVLGVLARSPRSAIAWTFVFGALWGVGAVTYGLTMRYLGMALGMSVALGFCAMFGTLIPPLVRGQIAAIAANDGGRIVLGGVALCLAGIVVSGYAGVRKDRECPAVLADGSKSNQAEFVLGKGLLVAFVCGVMSACFAFGIQSGAPIAEQAVAAGVNPLFQNNAALCVILLGGFLTNTVWCLYLNARNRTFGSYGSASPGQTLQILALCAAAGVIWYFQFFFYGMGMTKMGAYSFSSWSLHMAFIIICGYLWGLVFKEWHGVSAATLATARIGILLLILSTVVIGWGNTVSQLSAAPH